MTAVEPERIHQKEVAIVQGVDISGQWNRMFEERVIWDYDTSKLDEITQIEGAESLGACYQCGKCTPVCPVDHVGDYSPRKIFRKTQIGYQPARKSRPVALHHLYELPACVS